MTMLRDRLYLLARVATALAPWLAAPANLLAQTCAAPIPVPASVNITASTCDSTISMPFISSGTVLNQGPDVVYRLTGPLAGVGTWSGWATLQPDPNVDLALFVCVGTCSTYATCFEWVDNGPGSSNALAIPGAGDIFLVVAHPSEALPTCGNYSLQVTYSTGGF